MMMLPGIPVGANSFAEDPAGGSVRTVVGCVRGALTVGGGFLTPSGRLGKGSRTCADVLLADTPETIMTTTRKTAYLSIRCRMINLRFKTCGDYCHSSEVAS